MFDWLKSSFRPPVFEAEEKTREAALAHLIAWIVGVLSVAYAFLPMLVAPERTAPPVALAAPLGVGVMSFVVVFLIHRGSIKIGSGLLVLSVWLGFVVMAGSMGGVRDPSFAGLILAVALAGLLMGKAISLVVVVMSCMAGWALAEAEVNQVLSIGHYTPEVVALNYAGLFILAAGLVAAADAGFGWLLGRVRENERDLRARNWELQQMRDSLEVRVSERTEDLNKRSRYLEAAAQIAYAAGEILDVETLMSESVALIRTAFDLYYVGLFLVDGTQEWAILRAGTGEAGRRMLARGHRIRVGEGMIGWSIAHAEARFAQNAQEDSVRLAPLDLPDTKAEAALPLRVRGRVIGALTVQSAAPAFFDQTAVTVLQTLADLLAVALNNAELFEESERAAVAVRHAYGEIASEAWEELLRNRGVWGYRYADDVLQPLVDDYDPLTEQALEKGTPVQSQRDDGYRLAVPLRVGDRIIGAIKYQRRAAEGPWAAEDIELLSALTEQLSQALDGARLYEQTQQQAIREQRINDIGVRFTNAVDVEAMLRIAVQELGRLPGVLEASVHVDLPSQGQGNGAI